DGGRAVETSVSTVVELQVLNANGAPVFEAVETWNVLEGDTLRVSLFAFDPDNPGYEPKLRLYEGGPLIDVDGQTATVSYTVTGLPDGAVFDEETLELIWKPGYTQAGTYHVHVTATDDGGGTGVPLSTQAIIPIVVSNANQAPQIGSVSNAFVDRGAVLEIPVSATDADGNPVTLTVSGLPPFATYTQTGTG